MHIGICESVCTSVYVLQYNTYVCITHIIELSNIYKMKQNDDVRLANGHFIARIETQDIPLNTKQIYT